MYNRTVQISSGGDMLVNVIVRRRGLFVSQVELATGSFPYKNCSNDFEVLAKVVKDDPPVLPRGGGFSTDFCAFVKQW